MRITELLLITSVVFLFGSCAGEREGDPDPLDPNLVLIFPAGYSMGWEGICGASPVHRVTVLYPFFISKYEVTFDEFDAYCAAAGADSASDCGHGRGRLPVTNITWTMAYHYCNWKSDQAGIRRAYSSFGELIDSAGDTTSSIVEVVGYRLPTEAEWELVARNKGARAGNEYSGSATPEDVAWFNRNTDSPQPVGTKRPNEFGIYDMSGNAGEYCNDWYGVYEPGAQTNPIGPSGRPAGNKVLRGGGWVSATAPPSPGCDVLMTAERESHGIATAGCDVGMRIVRTYRAPAAGKRR